MPSRYPMKDKYSTMAIGDCEVTKDYKFYRAAYSYAKAHPPLKFSVRKLEGGYGTWRIA
jgi:hypothetical protein